MMINRNKKDYSNTTGLIAIGKKKRIDITLQADIAEAEHLHKS